MTTAKGTTIFEAWHCTHTFFEKQCAAPTKDITSQVVLGVTHHKIAEFTDIHKLGLDGAFNHFNWVHLNFEAPLEVNVNAAATETHASMTAGDVVIEYTIDNITTIWFCARNGWRKMLSLKGKLEVM